MDQRRRRSDGVRLAAAVAVLLGAAPSEPVPRLTPLPGFRAEVAALIVQGIPGGGLPFATAVLPELEGAAGAAAAETPFLIELPVVALQAGDEAPAAAARVLELYVYALEPAGGVVAHWARRVEVAPGAAAAGLRVHGALALGEGERSVRFLVVDPVQRRFGLRIETVRPEPASPGTPRFAAGCAGWRRLGVAEQLDPGIAARPLLVAGSPARLGVATPAAAAPPAGWRVRFAAARDAAAGPVPDPASAPARLVGPAPAVRGVELEFAVPRLEPGAWRLDLVDPAGHSSPQVEAWIVERLPPADPGCAASWSDVLRLALASGPAPAEAAPPAGPRRRVEAAYRRLLQEASVAPDLGSAAARLVALESEAPGELSLWLAELSGVQMAVARELAEREPRCLLPMIALHARAYERHFDAGRFAFATHSRARVTELAELAARRTDLGEDRRLIAAALTELARAGERRSMSVAAQGLLERALELDAEQEAARLLLAASYERTARYGDARRVLEGLLAANAKSMEARLRLTVILLREGESAAAERMLERIVGERPRGWLLPLAHQLLAELLIGQQRYEEAVARLARARRELPGDRGLLVQHAYALDRLGRLDEALALLAEPPPEGADPGGTPRFRYTRTDAEASGWAEEALEQGVMARLPLLAAVAAPAAAGRESR